MAQIGTSFCDDPLLERYYGQRYRIWSKFDSGIWMTRSGWAATTPESIAQYHAQRHKRRIGTSCVLDLFSGCGGDTIALACIYDKVIAIDNDIETIKAAKKNAEVYGVLEKIDFYCVDAFSTFVDSFIIDAVHASPPWGGEAYTAYESFDIHKPLLSSGESLQATISRIQSLSPNCSIFLPRTILTRDLAACSIESPMEIVEHRLNEKSKAITAFFGDLVPELCLGDPSKSNFQRNLLAPIPELAVDFSSVNLF